MEGQKPTAIRWWLSRGCSPKPVQESGATLTRQCLSTCPFPFSPFSLFRLRLWLRDSGYQHGVRKHRSAIASLERLFSFRHYRDTHPSRERRYRTVTRRCVSVRGKIHSTCFYYTRMQVVSM